ncbi:MAG TPA: TetR/AcrR family transcriptional regulator [Spirochaetota bacterium]|nr:TetR/AcrR family transcriptional regulator [Spirochaetota bacterium]HPV40769.1 TetR/AcrR family transcriptional regulator [Spirochaetota bacterium]
MNKNNTLSDLKEKEKDARRKIIVDAAEREFATKPFNKVTMRDIAKRAGISPALIYRHFPDQQSLFAETFSRGVQEVFKGLYKTIDESPDGSIEEIARVFIEYFTLHDQYFRMLMNFFMEGSVDRDLFDKLNVMESQMLDNFDIIFRKMKLKGNIRLHSHTMFAALTGIVATFRNHPLKSDDEILKHRRLVAENLARLFMGLADRQD